MSVDVMHMASHRTTARQLDLFTHASSQTYRHPRGDQFPFRDQLKPGESARGYLLRMATSNGLQGLVGLQACFDDQVTTTLDQEFAPRISEWFGADINALRHALGQVAVRKGRTEYLFAGQYGFARQHFNRQKCRVCVQCLLTEPVCRMEWELSAVTACPEHRKVLLEQCPSCGCAIGWRRLSVCVCECGYDLRSASCLIPCTDPEQSIGQWARDRVLSALTDASNAKAWKAKALHTDCPLVRVLNGLDLCTGMHLIFALFRAERTFNPYPKRTKHVTVDLDAMRALIGTADAMMSRLIVEKFDWPRDERHFGLRDALTAVAASAESQHAQTFAVELFRILTRINPVASGRQRSPQLSQYSLPL